jgi:hypothetical protein
MVRALLDQLDLHVARIGKPDRQVDVVVALSAVAERGEWQAFGIEPRADTANLDPVLHRCLDIGNDVAHLAQRSEKATHGGSSYLVVARQVWLHWPVEPGR